jgi:hypothetical protein
MVSAILLATTWGAACGGGASPKPDAGDAVDAAKGLAGDALTTFDPVDAQGASPDLSPADETTEAEPFQPPDASALPPDAGIDAPIPQVDAPLTVIDAACTDDSSAPDSRESGTPEARDSATRDTANERARRDSSPDRRAEAGADAPANLVVPEVNGTVYTFRFGDTVFAVDAAQGARIVTFAMGGHNVLAAAKDASDINWGSTFWTSPQTDWSWPPPTEIDPNPYTASVAGATLTLTGATANALGLSVTKIFTADSVAGVVTIEYRISNRGTRSRSVAPWEITRVAAGGLTFFPMGEGSPSKGAQPLLPLAISDGVAWLTYDPEVITSDSKAFADGSEGWIAHATNDLLFVKTFGDIEPTQAAPGEAEIELFANPTKLYIELEEQGALTRLNAGSSLTWTTRWFLRELDPSVSVEPGSTSLLNTVRTLVRD